MKQHYFTVRSSIYVVHCKMYCDAPENIRQAVLFCHGFGGSKENRAAKKFAKRYLALKKGRAVVTFDWPSHGKDFNRRLRLSVCMRYLHAMVRHLRDTLGVPELRLYAASFGGYLSLLYLTRYGNPFRALALRCPAVNMYDVLTQNILSKRDCACVAHGLTVRTNFDRKIPVDRTLLKELERTDMLHTDFRAEREHIRILHGTRDETVPIGPIRTFAQENGIPFVTVENADHRFSDPACMNTAIEEILRFFEA